MFGYDPLAPLETRQTGVATVDDLTYSSPMGGKVPAFLVTPAAGGPWAGLIYMHPGQGDRRTFLPEALDLARRGAVSLLIDAPYLRPEFAWSPEPDGEADARMYRQLVTDVRRGIDLLITLPGVDPTRIGYVGHSLGATWGGPLAGVEPRLRTLVLMAGYPSLTDWHRTSGHALAVGLRSRLTPEQLEAYLAPLAPLDAVHHVGKAGAPLLFQFATDDEFVTREQAEQYFAAAPEPKAIGWYDADHLFTRCREARADRMRWLTENLALGAASS